MELSNHALRWLPYWAQDLGVSVYNTYLYRQRHTGDYRQFRQYFQSMDAAPADLVQEEADRRLSAFLSFATNRSEWYRESGGTSLSEFPILEKSDIVANLKSIATVGEGQAIVGRTGGTTGTSMKVLFSRRDMQERFAVLDHFRSQYGYALGRKTAWFSGKHLASRADIQRGRCFRDDRFNNIRFFSTFHINEANFGRYWRALEDYAPEYIVGFPSSIYEICSVAHARELQATVPVKAYFPTAETVLPTHRDIVRRVLGCRTVDQYASAEGAPFILECPEGTLHIHPLTGVFEVVDESMRPAEEGELLVTSFSTRGTPLIRYRIGDRVKLASDEFRCPCGSRFPVVHWIDGRTSDFLWSPEFGRVNLGNLSNSTKGIDGIIRFQAVQSALDVVDVHVVGTDRFDSSQESRFLSALRLRLGRSMIVRIARVPEIPRESSGKFRLVRNLVATEVPGMAPEQRDHAAGPARESSK